MIEKGQKYNRLSASGRSNVFFCYLWKLSQIALLLEPSNPLS